MEQDNQIENQEDELKKYLISHNIEYYPIYNKDILNKIYNLFFKCIIPNNNDNNAIVNLYLGIYNKIKGDTENMLRYLKLASEGKYNHGDSLLAVYYKEIYDLTKSKESYDEMIYYLSRSKAVTQSKNIIEKLPFDFTVIKKLDSWSYYKHETDRNRYYIVEIMSTFIDNVKSIVEKYNGTFYLNAKKIDPFTLKVLGSLSLSEVNKDILSKMNKNDIYCLVSNIFIILSGKLQYKDDIEKLHLQYKVILKCLDNCKFYVSD